ncbi:uncharacterized protein LOC111605875 [Xiphophorus maculatus]|uniref:uncharacterized protein LOC111605875 n=1 Tax=Xiphophorus maculatus TaxID=8083 RepID=UPI0003B60883|nr:uncharacterized protein LOC111605875 [Xiphophorus maculatus]
MGDLGFLADQQSAALVVFFFLQPDSKDLNYNKELCSKGNELIASREINGNGNNVEAEEHGELQTDGHLPGNITGYLEDILPLVELPGPGGQQEVINMQAVAQDLREIAAQLELQVVVRAAQNLASNVSESPSELGNHLVNEVERLLREASLKDLPQEQVVLALTLTLVKGVCIQAPWLLKSLFDMAVRFICNRWTRSCSTGSD